MAATSSAGSGRLLVPAVVATGALVGACWWGLSRWSQSGDNRDAAAATATAGEAEAAGGGGGGDAGIADVASRTRAEEGGAPTASASAMSGDGGSALGARVSELWVYPVKSLAGVRASRVSLNRDGLRHDRAFMVVDAARDGSPFVTQRNLPLLALVRPTLIFADGSTTAGATHAEGGSPADCTPERLVRLHLSCPALFGEEDPGVVVTLSGPDGEPEAAATTPKASAAAAAAAGGESGEGNSSVAGAEASADSAAAGDVLVWGKPAKGIDCGDAAAAFLRRIAEADGSSRCLAYNLRLVRVPPTGSGRSAAAHSCAEGAGNTVAYTDQAPLLLLAEESVSDLNSRIRERTADGSTPTAVTARNFRPNIVVAGVSHPNAEDQLTRFRLSGDPSVLLHGVDNCSRCRMTTVDPDRGVFHASKEPTQTLRGYRMLRRDDPEGSSYKNQWFFGKHVMHHGPSTGSFAVGDILLPDELDKPEEP